MATYAAYRHIELDNVGYGKKRVLKPPGGGSSDIFGSAEQTAHRRVKNHLASSVFLSDEPSTPSTPSRSPVTNEDAYDGAETPATPNGNTSPTSNGNRITNGGTSPAPAPAAPRQRVPPGGYSSGLW